MAQLPRPQYTRVTGQTYNQTLARKLIPTADMMRDLYTKFGLRPYVARIIHTKWSSGNRGRGVEEVVAELVIEPTPKISDLTGVTEIITPVGLDEVGELLLTQISGAYTEENLRGEFPDGTMPDLDTQVYYEIEFPVPGGDSERRRFALRGAPYYRAGGFQWSLRLERTREDRNRDGTPA